MKVLATVLAGLMLWMSLACPAQALFSEVTIADEAEMGREFHQKIKSMLPLVEDPMITDYVESVVERVVGAMPPQPFRVTTSVINNRQLNAFAVPGGYVYVLTGLLLFLDNEDQLAGVISHELAHVSQRHVAKRMEDMELVSIGSWVGIIAGAFLGSSGSDSTREAGQALMTTAQAGVATAFLVYTKKNEVEADHVGMNYLVNAGYRPQGMAETFRVMLDQRWGAGGGSHLPSYLSTHPGLAERIDYLNTRVREMPADIRGRQTDNSRFLRVRAIVRGRLSDPTSSLAYYQDLQESEYSCLDYMARGMLFARVKKRAEAEQSFERALACGGSDPLVLREAGSFYFKQGDFDRASALLQQALVRDPGDILTLFFNARLLGEQKQYSQAIATMRKVLEEVPEDAEVHYHLGRMLGSSGDIFSAHLHLAYAAAYSRDKDQARFHRGKAAGRAASQEQKAELEKLDKTLEDRF